MLISQVGIFIKWSWVIFYKKEAFFFIKRSVFLKKIVVFLKFKEIGVKIETKCTNFVDSFANGEFVKSNGDLHGSVANFTCNDRFILFGPSSITCDAPTEDAPWPSVTASCIGVLFAVVLPAFSHSITNR